jgi:hypothetical protein
MDANARVHHAVALDQDVSGGATDDNPCRKTTLGPQIHLYLNLSQACLGKRFLCLLSIRKDP